MIDEKIEKLLKAYKNKLVEIKKVNHYISIKAQ